MSEQLHQRLHISGSGTHCLLDVSVGLACREVRADVRGQRRRLGDQLRAVDERVCVDAENREPVEHVGERLLELFLIVRERLPLARGTRVSGEEMIRLQTHLATERGRHLAVDTALSGERLATELGLDEELGVEDSGGRVEGRARDRVVDAVGCSNSVCRKQPHDLEVLEADIEHTCQDFINGV